MHATGWSHGLEVTGGGTGIVSHAGLAPTPGSLGVWGLLGCYLLSVLYVVVRLL